MEYLKYHLLHPNKITPTIPTHKEIAKGTLRTILSDDGLTTEEFIKLLK